MYTSPVGLLSKLDHASGRSHVAEAFSCLHSQYTIPCQALASLCYLQHRQGSAVLTAFSSGVMVCLDGQNGTAVVCSAPGGEFSPRRYPYVTYSAPSRSVLRSKAPKRAARSYSSLLRAVSCTRARAPLARNQPRPLPASYCSKGSSIVCASSPLAFGAFLNVALTCRIGGMSMPWPPSSSATVRICSLGCLPQGEP